MIKLPKNEKLNIQAFANMLDLKWLKNSYKLYWFTAIFEEIKLGNSEISFKKLVSRMISKSWYSIIEFKLNFGNLDQLNKAVLYIYKKYNINKEIKEEKLICFLMTLDDKKFNKITAIFYNYVPYRLLSPFYLELKGIKDNDKNKLIKQFSQKTNNGIYQILNDKIIINKNWNEYISGNQIIIEGWVNYKLITFLQRKNPNTPGIVFKISAPQKRNLNKATKFWKKIIEINSIKDIYSLDEISKYKEISIDHFIPWSFVLHDELWNLIPTFKSINSSKSDRLPNLDIYLDRFCNLQYKAFKIAINYGFSSKSLEDYLNIKNDLLSKNVDKNYFKKSLKDTIVPIYQIAHNQGFQIWNRKF